MDKGRLRDAAFSGVRWVAAGRVAVELFAFGSAVVLARLVSPAAFGQAAVALILAVYATALIAQSLGTPLVQRSTLERAHAQSAMLLSLLLGASLSAGTWLVAPLLSGVFGAEIAHLIRLMAPVFAISSVGIVPHALLQRSLEFRRIAMVEVLSIVARAVASVALAIAGLGASALVLGVLCGSAAFALLLLASAPAIRPGWDRRRAREILRFGVPVAINSFVEQTNRNVDYAILGSQLAPAQVGFYWRGYQLGVEYQRKVTTITTRMALPIFSRSRTIEDMRRMRVRMMRLNAVVIIGALAVFVAVAPVLVPWVFGPAWEPSVLPAQILAVAGMVMVTNTGAGPLVLAAGRPHALLWLNLVFFAGYSATVFLAAPYGLIAICVAVTAAQVARTAAMHWFLVDRVVGIPFGDLRYELLPAVTAGAALLGVAIPTTALLDGAGMAAPVVVALAALAGFAVYLSVLRAMFPAAWRDVLDVGRRVFRGRSRDRALAGQPAASAARS